MAVEQLVCKVCEGKWANGDERRINSARTAQEGVIVAAAVLKHWYEKFLL